MKKFTAILGSALFLLNSCNSNYQESCSQEQHQPADQNSMIQKQKLITQKYESLLLLKESDYELIPKTKLVYSSSLKQNFSKAVKYVKNFEYIQRGEVANFSLKVHAETKLTEEQKKTHKNKQQYCITYKNIM